MTKSFDRESHPKIVNKTRSYDVVVQLSPSYLPSGNQVVQVDSFISRPRLVTNYVMQGSLQGPLLCLFYFNYVSDAVQNGVDFLFAGDIKTDCTLCPEALEFNTSKALQECAMQFT